MRALIAAVAVCGLTFFTAGCAAGGGKAGPGGTSSVVSVRFVRPSAAPGGSADAWAKVICDDVRGNVLGTDARAFGAELGRMTAFRAQRDTTAEERARQAAVAKLTEIAGKLRTHAAEVSDPRLRSALNGSAGRLDRLGADPGTFAGLDSLDAVSAATGTFAAALGDVADYCSA